LLKHDHDHLKGHSTVDWAR